MDAPQTQQQNSETTRLPFDVDFYKRCEEFCGTTINNVPELVGIAIIPIWANQPENTPSGLLKLRNQQPPYISGLLALLGRIAAFSVDVQRDFLAQLKMFDQYAAELAGKIKERVEQLNELSKPINDQPDADKR